MKYFTALMLCLSLFFNCRSQETGKYIDSRDGKVYKTVKIGEQWILAENFAYKPDSGNYWVFENKSENVSFYGYYYDLKTAVSVIPKGWHLPSLTEWGALQKILGDKRTGRNDEFYTLLKLIEHGSSGFNALLCGNCFKDLGKTVYGSLEGFTSYWCYNNIPAVFMVNACSSIIETGAGWQLKNKSQGHCLRLFLDVNSDSLIIKDPDIPKEKEYDSVRIGNQTWMKENLRADHYSNGDPINRVTENSIWKSTTEGAYCWYNNDPDLQKPYGAIYNWYAVNDPRNICPSGWHVPNNTEWETLLEYLGGINEAAIKLGETGSAWLCKTGFNNSSGFSAFPAGVRDPYGLYYLITLAAHWWSASEKDEKSGWYYAMTPALGMVRYDNKKTIGKSVRCIKDE